MAVSSEPLSRHRKSSRTLLVELRSNSTLLVVTHYPSRAVTEVHQALQVCELDAGILLTPTISLCQHEVGLLLKKTALGQTDSQPSLVFRSSTRLVRFLNREKPHKDQVVGILWSSY